MTDRRRQRSGPRPDEAGCQPTVAVVVPTKDSGRTLEACLKSVRSQTYPAVELIVVDNHSTDATAEIAARYADLLITAGPERSAQRNRGAAESDAELLCFLDSDLNLDPGVIAGAVPTFSADPSVGAVVIPELAFGDGFWASCRALEKSLYLGDPHVEAARIFRRRAFEEVGGYDESMTGSEDWDLSERVEAAGYRLGWTASFARHDEGRLTLAGTFAKKRYYGYSSAGYLSRAGGRGARRLLRISLVRRPLHLLGRPHLTAGLGVLKAIEAAGFAVGVRDRSRARPDEWGVHAR